jgi:uncharacterized membrane protein
MNKTNFGFGQFWSHTPTFIKKLRVALLGLISACLIYMPTISRWTGITVDDLNTITGIVLAALSALLQMFGVNPDSDIPPDSSPSK